MTVYPTELWLLVILMFMFVLFMGMVFFAPFLPHVMARIGKKKLLGMIDRSGDIRLVPADMRNGMYNVKKKNWHFVKQYPGTARLYGVSFDLVHMDRGFVQDPYVNAALAELNEKYGIKNYEDLEWALDNNIITEEDIRVPMFFKIPLDEVIDYAADVPPASIAGEVDDMFQAQKTAEINQLKALMPWIVIALMLIIGGALAYAIVASVK